MMNSQARTQPASMTEVLKGAVLRVTAFVVMLALTVYEGVLLLFVKERPNPALPTERSAETPARDIPELEASDLDPKQLREYVRTSTPVIIRNLDRGLIEEIPKSFADLTADVPERLLIDVRVFPRLPVFSRWLKRFVGRPVVYMARFTGSYEAGYAHVDSVPSYNFYYVERGRKRVYIVPRQYNDQLDLRPGFDSLFVGKDKPGSAQLEWLEDLPAYYTCELGEGDALLFHNSACVHKFVNLTTNPQIYTVRLASVDAYRGVLRNDLFNWKGALTFAEILLSRTTVRATEDV